MGECGSEGVREGVLQAKQKPPEDRPAASVATPFGMAMSAYFCIKSILVEGYTHALFADIILKKCRV